jgi:Nucleotidyl transferase AbiEii toxin, Type IV TA system
VDRLHERLARIAFNAGDELGLVLAGGYAISAHQLTERPSRDLDLATASPLPLGAITDRLAYAYRAEGFTVAVVESSALMARLEVTTGDEMCEVDLLKEAIGPPSCWTSVRCLPSMMPSA